MRYYSKPKMDALEDEKGSWRTGTGNKRRARLRLQLDLIPLIIHITVVIASIYHPFHLYIRLQQSP